MLTRNKPAAWSAVTVVAVFAFALSGCGGGSGGDDDGGLSSFLSVLAPPGIGNLDGTEVINPYPTTPQTGLPVPPGVQGAVPGGFGDVGYNVAPPVFPAGNQNSTDFIELNFNVPLDATSITSSPPTGNDGIVITDDQGAIVEFFLDETGAIDSGNAFPSSGVAPSRLRLYPRNSMTQGAGTFTAGTYNLRITNGLRSFSGGPFCTGPGGSNCTNEVLPQWSFTIDNDTTGIAMAAPNPSFPVQNDPAAAVNTEIILNFTEAVNFEQLVGPGVTSTLDPFVTVPIPFGNVDCNGQLLPFFAQGFGNLYLAYTPPVDNATGLPEAIPMNLGCVVYMPEPELNPTQVRLRFCDISNLQGVDNPAMQMFQNYSSGNFPIVSNDPSMAGAGLSLPSILPVPGSFPADAIGPRPALFDVVVLGGNFTGNGEYTVPPFPPLPMMAMPCFAEFQSPGPGALGGGAIGPGATDRSGNALATSFWLRFTWDIGPPLARNSVPPDSVFVGTQQGDQIGIANINTAASTTNLGPGPNCPLIPNTQGPVGNGASVVGTLSLSPNRLAQQDVLGQPLDIEVGAFLLSAVNPAQFTNIIQNPPRAMVIQAGVPDAQDVSGPCGLLDIILFPNGFAPPVQPLGNFLYVVDGTSEEVKVFNSYDFTLITTLVGIPTPGGLGISPDLANLYVSNFEQGTIQRLIANPASPLFHTISQTVPVGVGPTAIGVQPGNEDVFVTNSVGGTYSIIDAGTQVERVRLAAGLGPDEVVLTQRMLGLPIAFTNAYQAFIFNRFSNDVSVYEADSPLSAPENGFEGRTVAVVSGFAGPNGGTWNWSTYIVQPLEPGCFVANAAGTTVDELTMFNFTISPPVGFPGPPGRRDFHILKSYSAASLPGGVGLVAPTDAVIENMSGLPEPNTLLTNNKGSVDTSVTPNAPSIVVVSFPSAGLVAGFDFNTPTILSTVSVPGCDLLHSYYDQ